MTTLTERVAALEAQLAPTAINDAVKYVVRTRPETAYIIPVYGRWIFGRRRLITPSQTYVVYISTVIDPNRTTTNTLRISHAHGPEFVAEFKDTEARGAQRQAAEWIAKQREAERAKRIYRALITSTGVQSVKLTEGDLR